MSALTWIDAAEAMLEGARMLPEAVRPPGTLKAAWWRDATGQRTESRDDARTACAEGCASYALGLPTSQPQSVEAWEALQCLYSARFGSAHIFMDNDRYGRDYVLANVKELLNEAAAEATP